jgi:phosphate-selective porin OprO/OprP
MRGGRGRVWSERVALATLLLLLGPGGGAEAQQPPLPSTTVPPAPAAMPVTAREAQLEERLRKLEARYDQMERRHAEQIDALTRRYEAVLGAMDGRGPPLDPTPPRYVPDTSSEGGAGARDNPSPPRDERGDGAPYDPTLPRRDTSREGGAGARDNPSDPARTKRPSQRPLPTRVEFGPGFQISSDDDEFRLQFHNLTQVDLRLYTQPGQDPVHSGLSIPRQRWYFTGRLTRMVEFYTTIQRSYGSLDLFDAFINFRHDDRFMFKVGRFKTPFSYEFYAMSAPDFIVPERSLFGSNFSPNRELGFMGWGQLFDKRLDYAVGMFNGSRLSFQDTNEAKDVISYLNARPFGTVEENDGLAFLRFLNVGGSVDYGRQNSAPLPSVLRTSTSATNGADSVNVAPPWLTFNRNVLEAGPRSLWGLHAAYFYQQLSLMAEWQSGYQSYTTGAGPPYTRVPINAWYISAGYFLTGETVDRRTQVEPLRPFSLRPGRFGPGAIELQGRYSYLDIGRSVFQNGLADPNLWTNRLYTIDLGVNWYLSAYTKLVFEWEHAVFGQPVLYAPGPRLQLTSDLLWARFQVYF